MEASRNGSMVPGSVSKIMGLFQEEIIDQRNMIPSVAQNSTGRLNREFDEIDNPPPPQALVARLK
jgi:hypothetical protein